MFIGRGWLDILILFSTSVLGRYSSSVLQNASIVSASPEYLRFLKPEHHSESRYSFNDVKWDFLWSLISGIAVSAVSVKVHQQPLTRHANLVIHECSEKIPIFCSRPSPSLPYLSNSGFRSLNIKADLDVFSLQNTITLYISDPRFWWNGAVSFR